jgi:O-antigen/teichoic acid export membrane protein
MKKSIVKNYFYNTLLTISNLIFPMITYPYVARTLSPENLGLANFAGSIAGYFTILAAYGFGNHGARAIARVRENKSKLNKTFSELFFLNTATSIIAGIAYFALVFSVSRFRGDIILYSILSMQILFNSLSIEWLYPGFEDYEYITKRNLIFKILVLPAVFIFIRDRGDVASYLLINVLALVVPYIINLIHSRRFVKLTIIDLDFKQHFKSLNTFFAAQGVGYVRKNSNTTILGLLDTNQSVSFLSINKRIFGILLQLSLSLVNVLIPRLSNIVANGQKNEYENLLDISKDFLMLINIPIIVGSLLLGREIILLFGGVQYITSMHAFYYFPFHLFFTIIVHYINFQIFIPLSKEKLLFYTNFIIAIVSISLNIILIPLFSFVGSAIALLVSEIIGLITQVILLKKYEIPFPFKIWTYWDILLGTFFFTGYIFLLFFLDISGPILLITGIMGSVVLYFGVLIFTKNRLVLLGLEKIFRFKK